MDPKSLFKHIISNGAENSPVQTLGKSWLELANQFGLNLNSPEKKRGKQVKDRWNSFKKSQKYRDKIKERDSAAVSENFEHDEKDSVMTTVSRTEFLYTKEDHIRFFDIDTDLTLIIHFNGTIFQI